MREACYVCMVLAIMIMLTVCLLFAPVLARDNMTGVRSLQYSSKTGRKVEKIQLCVMLSTAFLICATPPSVISRYASRFVSMLFRAEWAT